MRGWGEHQAKSDVSLLTNNLCPNQPSRVAVSIPTWVELQCGGWYLPKAATSRGDGTPLMIWGLLLSSCIWGNWGDHSGSDI